MAAELVPVVSQATRKRRAHSVNEDGAPPVLVRTFSGIGTPTVSKRVGVNMPGRRAADSPVMVTGAVVLPAESTP